MAALAIPFGSELDMFQQNEEGKVMTLKLSKEYVEEGDQSVMKFLEVVVDVKRKNGVTLHEWTVKYMYMVQVHKLYPCTSSMAEKLVKRHPKKNGDEGEARGSEHADGPVAQTENLDENEEKAEI